MESIERISPEEAKGLIDNDGYIYLDVRSIPEYEQGHPDGAWNIPLMHMDPMRGMVPNPDFLTVAEHVLPKDQPVIVGCQSGNRSIRAAALLAQSGWQDVVDQRSGFGGARDPATGAIVDPGWAESGLPVRQGQPDDVSYEALVARIPSD
jgi:rhodanese-related sulfurtransferase